MEFSETDLDCIVESCGSTGNISGVTERRTAVNRGTVVDSLNDIVKENETHVVATTSVGVKGHATG